MYYAKNRKNGSIDEAIVALEQYAYECPVCGTSVHLRRGKKNRIHFAHDNGLANLDCENYHPSNYEGNNLYKPIKYQTGLINRPELGSVPYLTVTVNDGFAEFYLKIPSVKSSDEWDGEILFAGKFGQKIINQYALRKDIYLPTHLLNESFRFSKTGNIPDNIWYLFEFGISSTSKEYVNVFSYSVNGGRHLNPTESLYRGNKYLIVLSDLLHSQYPVEQFRDYITEMTHHSSGWSVFELQLPEGKLAQNLENILSKWIKNPIKDRPPEIQFFDSYPVSISSDGSFIFPKSTETIRFKYFSKDLSVAAINKGFCNVSSETHISELIFQIYFDSEPEGEILICADNEPTLSISFEAHDFFNPTGITIKCGDSSSELYSAKSLLELSLKNNIPSEIVIPSLKASSIIKISGEKLDNVDDFYALITKHKNNLIIKADNFGQILFLNDPLDKYLENAPQDILLSIQMVMSISNPRRVLKRTYFPCQDSNWWNSMPKEASILRTRHWDANDLPLLISLKNKLHKAYGS